MLMKLIKMFENTVVGANGLSKEKQEEALEKAESLMRFSYRSSKRDDNDDDDEYKGKVNQEHIYTLSSLEFI